MEATLNRGQWAAPGDSILRIAALVTMVAWMALLHFVPVSANDFWLQAKVGQIIVETGEIPKTVLFPFTWAKDHAFNAHEWLPSIVFHLLDKAFGNDGLLFVQGTIGLLQFGLCVLLARRLSGSLGAALLLAALAMVVANYRYHLRPEIFALLLLVLLLHVLSVYREERRHHVLLWSVLIAVIWANAHGSFLLGPVVASIYAAGESLQSLRHPVGNSARVRLTQAATASAPYVAVAIAMAVASLLNPAGIGLLRFALELSASDVTKTFVSEWSPTLSAQFMTRAPFWIFVGASLGAITLVAANRRHVTATDLLLLLGFTGLALQRTRFVVLFGLVALAVCARIIGAGGPWRRVSDRALMAGAIALSVVGTALTLRFGNVWGAYPFAAPTNNFTAPMLERLSRPEMKGNVYNSYELGAELIYRTYPRLRPSIDSRIDSYGDRYFLLHENMLFDEAPMRAFIADFDVRYMLLTRRDFDRIRLKEELMSGWRVDYVDRRNILLERRSD
jgi:hypothetical protein